MGARQRHAALYLLYRLLKLASARKRDAQGVVGLGSHRPRLSRPLGMRDRLLLGLGERLFGPSDGTCVIAGSKSETAHLLEELGTLDHITVLTQLLQSPVKAGLRPLSLAGLPV